MSDEYNTKIPQSALANMLERQLHTYNEGRDGEDILSYAQIFSHANNYYRLDSADRYRILSRYFNETDLSFIDTLESKFSKRPNSQKDVSPSSNTGYLLSTLENLEDYFHGNYIETRKTNEVFYALARIVNLPESDIIFAFMEGWCLDIEFYRQQFAHDICQYYFYKGGGNIAVLARRIKEAGYNKFSEATLSSLLKGSAQITCWQFLILAVFLKVPENIEHRCYYQLVLSQELSSYKYGYAEIVDLVRKKPSDYFEKALVKNLKSLRATKPTRQMQSELADLLAFREAYQKMFPAGEEGLIQALYRDNGYIIEPYPDNAETYGMLVERWLLSYKQLQIPTSDGKKYIIDRDDYLDIVRKASDYAEYLLWKEALDPDKAEQDDTDTLQMDDVDLDDDTFF